MVSAATLNQTIANDLVIAVSSQFAGRLFYLKNSAGQQ